MKNKYCSKAIVLLLVLVLSPALPMSLKAQQQDDASLQRRTYSQEELDSLLAPIALYPDTLLSQVLMAATYPLEVVEADRWMRNNPGLTGDMLDAALQEKPWDVSVKSLCYFPRVLATMSENLQLTNDMGNAFLGQQNQVMDTIQALRAKAKAQGNLSSTDKQKVTDDQGAIAIEPSSPDIIYVPAYDPCWVYGPWWYSACTPLWFWYPGFVIGTGFFFGPAVFIGPLGPWCGFRWHRHEIFINVNRTFAVQRASITRMHGGIETWSHNPVHRRGISYHNPDIARRFGQVQRPGVEARRSFRGFVPERGGSGMGITPQVRPQTGTLTNPSRNAGPVTRQQAGPASPQAAQPKIQPSITGPITRQQLEPVRPQPARPEISPRSSAPAFVNRPSVQPQRGNAFESFESSGREVNQHSERGSSSMGAPARSGGGSRGGGGSPGRGQR